jgi:hypothetical protein
MKLLRREQLAARRFALGGGSGKPTAGDLFFCSKFLFDLCNQTFIFPPVR